MNVMNEGQAFARATASEANGSDNGETSNSAASEAGNVEKIREIIFGGQMRDYDKRFSRLEEQLIRESTELREENRRALEALETFVKKEIEALIGRLQYERQNREGAVQNVARELHETTRTLESRLAQFDNQTTSAQLALREQILDQSKTLNEEMRRRYEDVSALLQREITDLSNQKTDRAALSSMFTELATRLNQGFNLPDDN